ncbi:MAG: NAD(P)-dependent oxidoreductase [Phycisphaerales bacterium]|nr:MAG: NAD(P)-dependent oxidoreductase [Phycisphaerales bacterium]
MNESPRRIGFIGTGVMGAPMAGHLIDAGHELTVHTRTKSKAQDLLDRGAAWADSPAEAADGQDVVISIVGTPRDVERTHLGEQGTLSATKPPVVIVDMTTSRPYLAARIAEVAKAKGVGAVDAPVSGGDVGARDATLSIMIGGEDGPVRRVWPILEVMGRQLVHHGPPGAGQHAKMVNQILVATNIVGVCEGLLYAAKAGLDPEKVIESVASGAAGSWSVSNLGPRMIRRDFEPGFFVEHFIKDLEIALDESAQMGLVMPGLALARRLYEEVRAQGHGRKAIHVLLPVLERMSD